jgi:acyl-CoA thioesterase
MPLSALNLANRIATMSEATSFRSHLDAVELVDGRASVDFPADWAQGRSTFGGLVAAVALRAMRAVVSPDHRPQSIQATFVGPLASGAADIATNLLRSGRTTTSVEARLSQDGELRAVVQAVFGQQRSSGVVVAGPAAPAVPPPDGVVEFPYLEGVTPTFTQHFGYRWTIGQAPFTQARDGEIGGWCRFREDQGLGDAEVVLALLDAWPAPVLSLLKQPAPASSVTWTVGLLDQAFTQPSDGWWLFHGRTIAAAAGYAQTSAILWAPDRRAVATSHQLVAVFDTPESAG